jgi:hypothetical protein
MLAGVVLAVVAAAPVQLRDIDRAAFNPFGPTGVLNLLVFVASDCPISNGYAAEIQRLCDGYGSKGLHCSLVYEDVAIEGAAVRAHLKDYRFRGVRAVVDRDRSVARLAGAATTPEAVLVDGRGAIRYTGRIDNQYVDVGKRRRVVTEHDVRDALDAVLTNRPVTTPKTTAVGCAIAPPEASRKQP